MLFQSIFYTITIIVSVTGRGPHHPRGEKISKHHVHYRPTKDTNQKITQDENLLHDTEHLQEHLEEIIDAPDLTSMTDEELEFYYFQVHDTDKNSKLDGLEILQAIQHTTHHAKEDHEHDEEETDKKEVKDVAPDDFDYYVDLIDQVFKEDDINDDGFLSYPEYVAGRKKEAANTANIKPVVQMIK